MTKATLSVYNPHCREELLMQDYDFFDEEVATQFRLAQKYMPHVGIEYYPSEFQEKHDEIVKSISIIFRNRKTDVAFDQPYPFINLFKDSFWVQMGEGFNYKHIYSKYLEELRNHVQNIYPFKESEINVEGFKEEYQKQSHILIDKVLAKYHNNISDLNSLTSKELADTFDTLISIHQLIPLLRAKKLPEAIKLYLEPSTRFPNKQKLTELFPLTLKGSSLYTSFDHIPVMDSYYHLPIIRCSEIIWNQFCLTEGKTTIKRDQFCLWLYRLRCFAYDLLEFPFSSKRYWHNINEIYMLYAKNKYISKYEFYNVNRWEASTNLLNNERAFSLRLQDARDLLNTFIREVKALSPLEQFLINCYESFGNELINKRLLMKCSYCGQFIQFNPHKKYCSLLSEGHDCGKQARNRRYYSANRKYVLPKIRKTTKELRAFYKSKGIKK